MGIIYPIIRNLDFYLIKTGLVEVGKCEMEKYDSTLALIHQI